MATTPEDTQPYGGGAGGKISKRPFRRSVHTTPYDRPPIALRNHNTGWLSKLVDPAQRLIASGASRLFSTVFRKRLPPSQPPSTTVFEPGSSCEARNTQLEAVTADTSFERQGDIEQSQGPSNSGNKDGALIELEQILKQKTFTRSEIESLTALLHSKTGDLTCENQDKRPDVIPLRLMSSPNQQERLPKAPATENGIESQLISTPLVTSSVLDEGVASPTELAKAYMGSRPLKMSPSMLGSQRQAFRESSSVLNSVPLPSKLPGTPLMPGNSWNSEAPKNGVITPRSRGRSAIYSMARTPYSRIHSLSTLKGVGSPADAYRQPSSSLQSVREQAIKRGSSVLENDIGSSGPIRRIRQKSNLLSSRGLGSRSSGMPLSISETEHGPGTAQSPSFSAWKPISFGDAKRDFTKASAERDNTLPGSSFLSGPSKSSEMASKILQQLDKLVSPKEKPSEPKLLTLMDKSPSKLSPTMLNGQALKSLENDYSSKFLGNVQDNNKSDGSPNKLISSVPYFTSHKQDKAKENGPLRLIAPCEKSNAKVNDVDYAVINKDDTTSVRSAAYVASSSVSYPQSKQGFQMSAHEGFLELDDEGHLNGAPFDLSAKGREKLDTFAERKSDVPEHVVLDKPSSLAEVKPLVCSAMNNKDDPGITDGSVHPDKGVGFIVSSTSLPSKMIPSTVVATQSSLSTVVASQFLTSDGATKAKESNVAPSLFNFGDKIASIKNSYSDSPVLNFGSKVVDKVSQPQSPIVATESTSIKFAFLSDAKPETTTCYHTVAASATDSQSNVSEPSKAGGKNNLLSGGSFTTSEATLAPAVPVSTSSANTFSFGQPSNSSGSKVGSFASTFKASTLSNNLTPQNSTSSHIFTSNVSNIFASSLSTATSNGGISTSTLAPSFPAAPIYKFGSCSASTAGVSVSVASDENKTKEDSSFGKLNIMPFGGTSASVRSTGSSSPFGFSATVTSTAENQYQGSTLFGAGSGSMPSAQASPPGTGVASFIESTPVQFGSTLSSTFEVAGNTTFSSGSVLSGSISASKLFGLGTVSGQSSSAPSSEANVVVSSSSGIKPNLFVSNWQPAKSSTCGSTFNFTSPSTGFSFGGSSTPSATAFSFEGSSPSSANAFSFGGSSSASSSSAFSFGGSSASSSSAFSFGGSSASSSSAFSFGESSASSATTNSTPIVSGLSNGASPNSLFSFVSSSASAPTLPVFGNTSPTFTFGDAALGNNNQMNMEDRMAEDNVQASTPTVPIFGQQQPVLSTPTTVQTTAPTVPAFGQQHVSTSFVFSSTGSSAGNPFQFGSQSNLALPQNPSPFQASGSLGSNFSLGSGGSGVDKSSRKYVKPVRNKHRKK